MTTVKRPAPDRPTHTDVPEHAAGTASRLAVATASGVAVMLVAGFTLGWSFAPLGGWDVVAVVTVGWTWVTIWPMDAERTAEHAVREDPNRAMTDLLLVAASVASLVGVGFVVVAGGNTEGLSRGLLIALAVITVVASWSMVHTTFTLRYARLYYTGKDGGIDFSEDSKAPPQYSDFAYVAFTIGMTFQVSDTDLTSKPIRATALRHALLSYLFGVVIIAVMINIVAGLAR